MTIPICCWTVEPPPFVGTPLKKCVMWFWWGEMGSRFSPLSLQRSLSALGDFPLLSLLSHWVPSKSCAKYLQTLMPNTFQISLSERAILYRSGNCSSKLGKMVKVIIFHVQFRRYRLGWLSWLAAGLRFQAVLAEWWYTVLDIACIIMMYTFCVSHFWVDFDIVSLCGYVNYVHIYVDQKNVLLVCWYENEWLGRCRNGMSVMVFRSQQQRGWSGVTSSHSQHWRILVGETNKQTNKQTDISMKSKKKNGW